MTAIIRPSPGGAAKTNPAPFAGGPAGGAGELSSVGKLPWRCVEGLYSHAVKDFHGTTLFLASPGIARQIVAAVNAYPTLLGDLVEATDVLRALAAQIGGMPKSQARTRALNLIEDTLHKDSAAS